MGNITPSNEKTYIEQYALSDHNGKEIEINNYEQLYDMIEECNRERKSYTIRNFGGCFSVRGILLTDVRGRGFELCVRGINNFRYYFKIETTIPFKFILKEKHNPIGIIELFEQYENLIVECWKVVGLSKKEQSEHADFNLYLVSSRGIHTRFSSSIGGYHVIGYDINNLVNNIPQFEHSRLMETLMKICRLFKIPFPTHCIDFTRSYCLFTLEKRLSPYKNYEKQLLRVIDTFLYDKNRYSEPT